MLVLLGTAILVVTLYEDVFWWKLHPPGGGAFTISDKVYSGVLTASNSSVVIPIEEGTILTLMGLKTNGTPISVIVMDGNGTELVRLVNISGMEQSGIDFIRVMGYLKWDGSGDYAQVMVVRESSDVEFELRIIAEGILYVTPVPEPIVWITAGYTTGMLLIIGGFYLIEQVIRDYDLQLT